MSAGSGQARQGGPDPARTPTPPTAETTRRVTTRRPGSRGSTASPVRPVGFEPPPTPRPGATATPAPPAPPAPPPTDTGSLLTRHPVSPELTVTHERVVEGELAETLWQQYVVNFRPMAELAALNHFESREEVLFQLAEPTIEKIIAWQGGEPVALGMVTNNLEVAPDISPAFMRARFPEHAARDAIYIGTLVMVAPGVRGMTVFNRIYTELWQVPARAGGVLVFDVCTFNRETFGVDVLASRIASMFPHSTLDVLDQQTWYYAELPEPIPEH